MAVYSGEAGEGGGGEASAHVTLNGLSSGPLLRGDDNFPASPLPRLPAYPPFATSPPAPPGGCRSGHLQPDDMQLISVRLQRSAHRQSGTHSRRYRLKTSVPWTRPVPSHPPNPASVAGQHQLHLAFEAVSCVPRLHRRDRASRCRQIWRSLPAGEQQREKCYEKSHPGLLPGTAAQPTLK